MDTASFSARLKHLGDEIRDLYTFDAVPWVVGYSGGKDSTATLGLIWWAVLLGLAIGQRLSSVPIPGLPHLLLEPTGVAGQSQDARGEPDARIR